MTYSPASLPAERPASSSEGSLFETWDTMERFVEERVVANQSDDEIGLALRDARIAELEAAIRHVIDQGLNDRQDQMQRHDMRARLTRLLEHAA
ncbi:hypothetical protein [Sphingobium abikonense]|uniref:hypothetical protein n=2 Tax=Sphingobium abikonense TaxID=86193 RepID=UPI0012ECC260|nr:hypothetical protein [Sphingobium abikonense]